jgi:hypothetical protein
MRLWRLVWVARVLEALRFSVTALSGDVHFSLLRSVLRLTP